jgi:hypothetical protein
MKSGRKSTSSRLALLLVLLLAVGVVLPGCFSSNKGQGKRLYDQKCASCHGDQGEGLARLIPPLAKSDYLIKHREELPCLLRYGQKGPIVVNGVGYNNVMPGYRAMSPAQLTNLLNYIESHWGNKASPRTIRAVEQQLEACREPAASPEHSHPAGAAEHHDGEGH